ncbi:MULTISPECIES: hypothetical protein [unclassified Nostoc]|nr:hypothetical protein [Nostoc sp. S13]MDF5734359.1 hypothetical protein [Nostoc sp. S13]
MHWLTVVGWIDTSKLNTCFYSNPTTYCYFGDRTLTTPTDYKQR